MYAKETDDYGVLQARVFGSGLVVLTGNYKFVLVPDLQEPRPRLLEDPGLSCEPESWTVIPPDISLSRHPEVLVATGDKLFLMDAPSCIDQVFS